MNDCLHALSALPPEAGGPRPGEGLLIALSGGADSVALTDLLRRLAPARDLRLVVAHLDHGLRAESAADADYCQALCARWELPFVRTRVVVRPQGAGLEAAARRIRLDWLESQRRHFGLDSIATGHHLDDHIETVLMWIERGAGLRGLGGIAPRRGCFVRPLRAFSRDRLRDYLRARGIPWREDPTNAAADRPRTRWRHRVLPALDRALGPRWRERVDGLSRRARLESQALDEFARAALEDLQVPDPRAEAGAGPRVLDRVAWQALGPARAFAVWRVAVDDRAARPVHQKWNENRFRDVLSFIATARTGRRRPLPGGGWLEVERDRLLLWPAGRRHTPPPPGVLGLSDPAAVVLHEESLPASLPALSFCEDGAAYLDADAVRPPLRLRPIRPGDRIQPLGMRGHKKLRRLLAERAVPRTWRDHQLVVEDRRRILWAVGLTTSEAVRVGPDTRRVLRLALSPRGTDAHDAQERIVSG